MTKTFSFHIAAALCMFIYLFKLARPLLGPRACRFTPTCTEYALEAVKKHGAFHGFFLALRRLFRCHPFNSGGWDPVP